MSSNYRGMYHAALQNHQPGHKSPKEQHSYLEETLRSNLTVALVRHPSKNRPGLIGVDPARPFGDKALKTSSSFSLVGSSALAILKKIASNLDQLETLIPESMSVAFVEKSVSNVIFRTRAEVTVWRIGSIQ